MSKHRRSDGNRPRIVVTVAPVAHSGTFLPDDCRNPVSPEEIAAELVRCESAGASVAHLHTRDAAGEITSDMEVFTHTLDLVCDRTSLIINGSTGGVSELSRADRCISLTEPRVEMASLNMGSSNFGDGVYVNTVEDIRYWAGRIATARVIPELEVFTTSMIQTALDLRDEGVLDEPMHFNVCLGFPGATPATPGELSHFVGVLPSGAEWGFLHEGMTNLRMTAAALGLGARAVRVGYEDGGYVVPDVAARSNAELVDNLVGLIRATGCDPASPSEAREMLGLAGGN